MAKPLQVYQSTDIVVTFDPNICMHFAECLRGAPEVFDVSRADWIRPEAASAEQVAAVVGRCPSGALQAVMPGHPPTKPLPSVGVTLVVTRDGPVVVKGAVQLELPTGITEKRQGSFSLCRCGQTRSTPYCDGSHARVGFKSPA
jgi:uncharacterized Fe-S cluster protein YjdI